jgi:hypothetical protein
MVTIAGKHKLVAADLLDVVALIVMLLVLLLNTR